ncbi:TspO/MBR family protein [Mesohalobacter halotolerans]|uniref:Tryptophan-rich sensory protein n=1 Tax=Mesohalobacter halotolerans TaxID=1883405 RepID=A0A4U5TV06_9FLAO|nr:TspO/MBR family protein [Mesohalobacter halotolerans]MBS3738768.1 tryptophan-rich sensory protein [Psychroflexus sp.]TKS57138.1 tryptophan-rich sensory protein [Mesohalobacter halotolerans]
MKTNTLLKIIISIVICLAVGFLASIATQTGVGGWYETIQKPSFTPPNAVFAPVWTVLYVLMGIAAGIVWSRGLHHIWVKTALYHFVFQLLFNALWSLVFFNLEQPLWALLVIITLLILILLTIKWFKVVNNLAAYLLIPYALWVAYALVINFEIWRLNS